jgi:hypothetical protein
VRSAAQPVFTQITHECFEGGQTPAKPGLSRISFATPEQMPLPLRGDAGAQRASSICR